MRFAISTFAVSVLVLNIGLSAQQPIPAALKTTTEHPPTPVDGIVTLNLASGAFFKVRATDIDYEKTSAYKNRVIIVATRMIPMVAKENGRKYQNFVFTNRFVATAWDDDIDFDEMRSAFPIYLTRLQAKAGMTLANFDRLHEGMSVSDVGAILGGSGKEESRSEISGHSSALYTWSNGDATVSAIFHDGQLASKSQFGLR